MISVTKVKTPMTALNGAGRNVDTAPTTDPQSPTRSGGLKPPPSPPSPPSPLSPPSPPSSPPPPPSELSPSSSLVLGLCNFRFY